MRLPILMVCLLIWYWKFFKTHTDKTPESPCLSLFARQLFFYEIRKDSLTTSHSLWNEDSDVLLTPSPLSTLGEVGYPHMR
jgi:hypothetical protein